MLQQTQASRVEAKYPEFLRRFPTLRRLAASRTSDVIRAWQGMGYNRRALNLHRAAKDIVGRYRGHIPSTTSLLATLPGLGPYTAHAIACFAFGASVPTVDTNIRRVLTRLFPGEAKHTGIWDLAEHVLPHRAAYDWNQGLMELGALVCTARSPKCGACPLEHLCPSAHRPVETGTKRMTERGRNGIPDRIYRGRIVEVLRHSSEPLTPLRIVRRAVPDLRGPEQKWFEGLLSALQKDGLIRAVRHGTSVRYALPD
jgi:A/G-specific adenine glycosylase